MAEEVSITKAYIGNTCIVSALGVGASQTYAAMLEGRSGLQFVNMPNVCETSLPIQKIADEYRHENLSRLESLMHKCVADIVEKTGIDVRSQRNVIVFATTKGNIADLTTEMPENDSRIYLYNMAMRVSQSLDFQTKPIVISNACISGVSAVIAAQRMIECGKYDNVVVVGGDEVTDFTTSGFLAFKSVSQSPCRPYDASRDGLSLGEAVAAILLTNNKMLSQGYHIAGGAMTNDANHISGPSRTGEPLAEAIRTSMAEAGAEISDVAFVNAHGTATLYNDEMESKAISLAGLSEKPINSLKPYFGHTLGASGVIEMVIGIEELRHHTLLGTLGYQSLGTPMPLNVSAQNRTVEGTCFVKTASGFGGCNASVVIMADEVDHAKNESVTDEVCTRKCHVKNGVISVDGSDVFSSHSADFSQFVREAYHAVESDAKYSIKFSKMSDLCRLGYVAMHHLLKGISYEPYDVAIVMANRSSSLEADLKHWRIFNEGEASPGAFVYTLPNIVLGEVAIRFGIKGETIFFVDNQVDTANEYAKMLLSKYPKTVVAWIEKSGDDYVFDATLYMKKQ